LLTFETALFFCVHPVFTWADIVGHIIRPVYNMESLN